MVLFTCRLLKLKLRYENPEVIGDAWSCLGRRRCQRGVSNWGMEGIERFRNGELMALPALLWEL